MGISLTRAEKLGLTIDHHNKDFASSIIYPQIGKNSPLYKIAEAHYKKLKGSHFTESEEFRCLGKTIICFLIDSNGKIIGAGDNRITQPVTYCVKDHKDQPNYVSCATICGQLCHAEIAASLSYLIDARILSEAEITQLASERVTLERVGSNGKKVIGKRIAHKALRDLIIEKDLRLPEGTAAYMYGHEVCCGQCAEILEMLGVQIVWVTPQSHADQRKERNNHNASEIAQSHMQEDNPYFTPDEFPDELQVVNLPEEVEG